jgi:hypothetical protein
MSFWAILTNSSLSLGKIAQNVYAVKEGQVCNKVTNNADLVQTDAMC